MLAIKKEVPLAIFSSFHIGGPAEYFVEVKTTEEAIEATNYAQQNNLSVFFLGGGSNVLFPDNGIAGLVIRSNINTIEAESDTVLKVGSGVYTTTLAQYCGEKSLSGIEALFGLPGTIGGAIRGNAGSLGTEIKDIVIDVTIINQKNELEIWPKEKLEFAYRESYIKTHPLFIVSCRMQLHPGKQEEIKQKMIETKNWRKEKQPGGFTAGSFFKNPPDTTAGFLIDSAGLKGYSIGGAQVSMIHANFFVNTGKGTNKDVMMLMAHVQSVVKEKFGIDLVPEVQIIPSR